MTTQQITINGASLRIPSYYQQADPMPDDPKDSVVYVLQTNHAKCVVRISPIQESETVPRNKEDLISGIRQFLTDDQGLIQVETGDDFVFSIVKTLIHPGVDYILRIEKYFPDNILCVQGEFWENGETGLRDNIVYAYCRKQGIIGNDKDPFWNWMLDPYDPEVKTGALRNYSERAIFDEHFPDFPLSLCRLLVDTILSNGESS